jgi:very-short-patch-repair endonuclease
VGHDEIIDDIAATQHGAAARYQLLPAGVSPTAVDRRVASGRLSVLYPGVYLARGHRCSWEARIMGACLAAGPGAVASHRAAAWLHGLAGCPPVVELSVPLGRHPRLRGVEVHRVSTLGPADVHPQAGIPCTRPARTLVDLAAVVTPDVLEAALDDALTRHLVTCAHLARRLDALGRPGRRGSGVLARLLQERAGGKPRSTSDFERRFFRILRQGGLPLPVPQFPVHLPTGRPAAIDYAYPDVLLAIECDSYLHHSSKRDWARDHTRNALLVSMGWRVLPVTWQDLEEPDRLLALVGRGLHVPPTTAGENVQTSTGGPPERRPARRRVREGGPA